MNVAAGRAGKASGVLFVDFNQDASCVSVGTADGFKVFNTYPKFTEVHNQEMGGVGICEMLFCSSLVALVGAGDQDSRVLSPRKLHMVNTKNKTTICELNFVTPVLAVKLNRKRMVVVMETKIHIYDIGTIKILHTIDTPPNPKGLVAFAPSDENCYLCYPASAERGEIALFDALMLQPLGVLHAHKTPVAKLSINQAGTLLASASNKGTVVRVFQLPDDTIRYQFRRGSYPANVHSIAFSADSSLLCVSSDTGTVHIFKVDSNSSAAPSKGGSQSYWPEVLSDMWETMPVRSFASIKLPSGIESLCAIASNNAVAMVATADGNFYHYKMDPKVGGELKLSTENRLHTTSGDEVGGQF
eukprot:TRINITY_DN9013_c0_g3_i2.p1 TRINITY_DN9013_c0_g3~~TRINITY_DN9013_c0_g3_i2.p1  ORF type:complete len:358 (+),score=128.19 TRINITY_DN9013_c0_g3_i2:216-1289(+)